MSASAHLAYLFERFPTYTQTFCVREVMELARGGMEVNAFSIRDTSDERDNQFPPELRARVHSLPSRELLKAFADAQKANDHLPQAAVLSLRHWGDQPDKSRLLEATYLGEQLRAQNLSHAHAHFAGMAARTLWWAHQLYGTRYSFTGHANDIFRKDEFALTLGHLVRDAAFVVTVSDFSASDLHARFPAHAHKIHRVYNGLDLQPFLPTKGSPPSGIASRNLLAVGRLIEKKGYADLVRACAKLKTKGADFHCRIVGEGPLREALEAQIREADLGNQVELLGERDQGEIADLLKKDTQIFVLPCVVEADGGMDNLPTVIMEAMAAGLPCVSTRLAGVPEMVDEFKTGLLVDTGDADGLAAALANLLDDSDTCAVLGAAGLQRAQSHFAKEVTSAQMRKLFVRYGATRFDSAHLSSYSSAFLASLPKRLAGRFQKGAKVRDEGFNVVDFMGRA